MALALDALPAAPARVLDEALGTPLEVDEVVRLRELIRSSGALDQLESVIAHLTDTALGALEQSDLDPDARQVLARLADEATQRTV